MSRNNDVFKVLVVKDNQGVAGRGQKVNNLTPGRIGVFDYHTNLAYDGTNALRDFYIAVGVDKNGDGITDDVVTSAGSHIQARNVVHFSVRKYRAPSPMKVILKDYIADCETEYGIKLDFKNQRIYMQQGYNQFTKTYTIKTSCCNGCEQTCPSGDANEITKLLYLSVLNDSTGLVIPHIIPRGTIPAAVGVTPDANGYLTLAQLDTIMAYNAAQPTPATFVYTNIEFETVPLKVRNFCAINLGYKYPRETIIGVSKIEGFKCNGSVFVTQQAVFEEGSGYDIKQWESEALGWTDSPYRTSAIDGMVNEAFFATNTSEKYDQIWLTYDQASIGGWEEFLSNQATLIAVPISVPIVTEVILQILQTQLNFSAAGFDNLVDDAQQASQTTANINDPNLDGIG